MPLKTFLEVSKQNPPELVVNPGSKYWKYFTKAESALLLNDKYLAAIGVKASNVRREKFGKLVLGKPKKHPEALLATLAEHFKTVDDLEAAHVMQVHNSDESLPHLLIAIDGVPISEEGEVPSRRT